MKKVVRASLPRSAMRRRDVLVWGAGMLAGCGGGGSGGGTAALPGTGGTGISVQGQITGFGSVIINGTKYDDSAATLHVDGQISNSSALRIGMVATVQGSKTASNLGTASSIDVWSVAQGPGGAVAGAGTLSLAGMTIRTDASTSYEGCADFAGLGTALTTGAWVTVWGIQATADASQWSATRIAVSAAGSGVIVSTGLAHLAGGQVTLNGWVLSGAGVSDLHDPQLVRVQGTLGGTANALVVSGIQILDSATTLNRAYVEAEGLVTVFNSKADFSVGALRVNADAAKITPSNASWNVASKLEVQGALVNGVLIATELEVRDAAAISGAALDITGTVTDFISARDFEVRGQKCDALTASFVGGVLANLAAGKLVRVVGTTQGKETLVVATLSFL